MGLEPTATVGGDLEQCLRERVGPAVLEVADHQGTPRVRIEPAALLQVVDCLRETPPWSCNALRLISTVDRPSENRIEVYYFLTSLPEPSQDVELVVWLPRDQPRIASLASRWPSANWQEREAYDLMGVIFDGHPDLRRILLPDVWQGHPLRKDYRYDADTMVDEILETFGYQRRPVDTWEREPARGEGWHQEAASS